MFGRARSQKKLADLVALDPQRITPVELDVTNAQAVSDGAARLQNVTLLINNAGILARAKGVAN